ncbi:hypothetical protein BX666DRAFT_2121996 [Dichotomocladium elegans]|nr:hypothetical protein BX666DRAFT_2121996 [Dichotomocladium elegans]
MNVSAILNPEQRFIDLHSDFHSDQNRLTPPPSPGNVLQLSPVSRIISNNSTKPRSRFSDIEDSIICEGVARGLTWGQISRQLPHRKRATCFNRYRTLQGIRKPRRRSSVASTSSTTFTISSKSTSLPSPLTSWIPSTPPDSSSAVSPTTHADLPGFYLPSPRQLLLISDDYFNSKDHLPPLIMPTARHAFHHHNHHNHHRPAF